MTKMSQSRTGTFLAIGFAVSLLLVEIVESASLYWTDERGVHRSDLDGQNPQTIVPVPINSIASMAIDEVEGKIYYADFSGRRILRSDLDGTNLETVIISGRQLYLRSLVVDSSRRKIYWVDFDKIFRANLDGTDTEMIVQAWEPRDLVIDEENGKIYWLDHYPKSPPVLGCANLDGSEQETVIAWDNPPLVFISPTAIAIDSNEQKIYFIRGGAIQRADTDGSNVEIVLDLEKEDFNVNFAVDTNGRQLYWTDSEAGTLYRATLDGGNVETIVQQAKIGAIALHSAGEKLYWVDKIQGLTVHCANLDGSRRVIVLDVPLRNYLGIDIDEHKGKIYWTSLTADRPEILRGNSDGTAIELLVETGLSKPTSIAVDGRGEKIYWVNSGNNKILRANLNGSATEEIVVHGKPREIEIDGESGKIYWIDASSGIHHANLDGTSVEVLIADIGNAQGLGINPLEQKIYWSVNNNQWLHSIRTADLNGRNRETVVEERKRNSVWRDIEIDGIHKKVYWINWSSELILRANLDGTKVETVISNLVKPYGITLDLSPDSVTAVEAHERTIVPWGHIRQNQLSQNYPNPFNPETWMPYQLAEAAKVTMKIRDTKGLMVRDLDLGLQPAGVHQSRSRAAYWDGRNQMGEPVASGVYFYTLTAGDFAATRKMLVNK